MLRSLLVVGSVHIHINRTEYSLFGVLDGFPYGIEPGGSPFGMGRPFFIRFDALFASSLLRMQLWGQSCFGFNVWDVPTRVSRSESTTNREAETAWQHQNDKRNESATTTIQTPIVRSQGHDGTLLVARKSNVSVWYFDSVECHTLGDLFVATFSVGQRCFIDYGTCSMGHVLGGFNTGAVISMEKSIFGSI